MGYSVGWDGDNARWKGYGVPCTCEQPGCDENIDRGMSHLCECCGLAFCYEHLPAGGECEACTDGRPQFPAKAENLEWLQHLRTDPSWSKWRKENEAQLTAWETAARRTQAHKEST